MLEKLKKYQFLFEELVKRDFTKKYKRTVLGMLWTILSPLLNLLVMWLVFSNFFGNNVDHYVIYLFAGQVVFSFFADSTSSGMGSLLENASIFTKINVPKYMFLFSKNISSLISFGLTLLVFFGFVAFDGLAFKLDFLMLLYPIVCLMIFNIGMGLILSALYTFFRDMQYLWSIIIQLMMYMSAIFYTIDNFSYTVRCIFLLNPVYVYIRYFRKIVIDGVIPSVGFHLIAAGYALVALGIGYWVYKKYNHEFLYYV
jgi:ABC-2 type transport system permease protein